MAQQYTFRRCFVGCVLVSCFFFMGTLYCTFDRRRNWKGPLPMAQESVNGTVPPAKSGALGPTVHPRPPQGKQSPPAPQVKKAATPQQRGKAQKTYAVELFPHWTTKDPKDVNLTSRFYLYSAIVDIHQPPHEGTAIHIVAFQDEKRSRQLKCCVIPSDSNQIFAGKPATKDFSYPSSFGLETFGMVHRCTFPIPSAQLRGGHVTLSSTSCPSDRKQYLEIQHPVVKPGEVAICAKIAYGFKLNPNLLVEWFEMQRLLGVDKVQLFDLNNTETVYKIFRHYQDTGFLHLLPYKLPGKPWGRFILKKGTDYARFGDDEELILWDCRLRLAGYEFVMDVDLDEIVMPHQFKSLKPYFQQAFSKRPDAAALYFKVQLFLDNWGPVDPQAPLRVLRYLNSTFSPGDVGKLVYLPNRTHQAFTHEIIPYKGYKKIKFVPTSDATLFHYRSCKMNWKFNCYGSRSTDRSMLRFQGQLVPAVLAVQKQLGLRPAR